MQTSSGCHSLSSLDIIGRRGKGLWVLCAVAHTKRKGLMSMDTGLERPSWYSDSVKRNRTSSVRH